MANAETHALVNIKRVEIITDEATPQTLTWDTASEAGYEPIVSEGEEKVLRTKNTIHAIDKTEDIQYGSDITLTDNKFAPEVLAIIDGGTLKKDAEQNIIGYTPPVSGQAVNRKTFTLNIYTEEKEGDEIVGYFKFSYPNCKGKPANFTFKDGEFTTPEFTISSRPKNGEAPYDLDILAQLP
ncbi:hypothetical protein CPJCM30710_24910 [Clostridium polyendosporum]|uniref:Phage major tail protein, phi13 family n=1 Tax=Clostridium polyendosporum TaxID=69208 RepID=A0A919S081_9CLOT|nr:hypothetical protein [Clostridium polyendosporum]GIM29825.1 hypothetical protein CPJCM30710_24910 [Clostridium polyendosporum]